MACGIEINRDFDGDLIPVVIRTLLAIVILVRMVRTVEELDLLSITSSIVGLSIRFAFGSSSGNLSFQLEWIPSQAKFHLVEALLQAESEPKKGVIVRCHFHPFKRFQDMELSGMACKMKECPNAGGSSVESEVMSLELLHRCFGAKLLKTEKEVKYSKFYKGCIVDYTCEMFRVNMGVSVTRAMKYKGEYKKTDAEKLLRRKLGGILNATQNALDKWSKQILHVWATSTKVADVLTAAYHDLPPELRINTILLVTVVTSPQHSMFGGHKSNSSAC